jgi:hypothetical protein
MLCIPRSLAGLGRCVARDLLFAAAATASTAGCSEEHGIVPLADASHLECSIQPLDYPGAGGLPGTLRFTVVNKGPEMRVVPLPRPQAPGDFMVDRNKFGPPFLYLILKHGQEESRDFLYTDVQASARVEGQAAVLKPSMSWSREYSLTDFYPWGPCGPATDCSLPKCFGPGTEDVMVEAALVLWPGEVAKSNSVTVKCTFEPWVFKKQ